jgi:hypothetical protein
MTETALANISPVKQALALATEAKDVGALRDVHAMATAFQKGAQARSLGIEAENEAAEVVLRSERALGRVLMEMEDQGLVAPRAGNNPLQLPTLVEVLGVDPQRRSRMLNWVVQWKAAAQMPDWLFEERLEEARKSGERIAKHNFYGKHKPKSDPVREAAMADLMEALHEDEDPAVFVAFDGAARGIIEEMSRLPLDILPRVAVLIRELANAYNEERMRRA